MYGNSVIHACKSKLDCSLQVNVQLSYLQQQARTLALAALQQMLLQCILCDRGTNVYVLVVGMVTVPLEQPEQDSAKSSRARSDNVRKGQYNVFMLGSQHGHPVCPRTLDIVAVKVILGVHGVDRRAAVSAGA